VFTSTPNPLEISHPQLRNKVFKTTITSFLLKKRTNPTPYSLISYFKKENKPLHTPHTSIIPYEVAKSP
jgi:hypothetical protein